MANAGLRFEDRLEGASNFSPWRERIGLLLEEQGLWEFAEGTTILPTIVEKVGIDKKSGRVRKTSFRKKLEKVGKKLLNLHAAARAILLEDG
jgi:hypothetical protein